MRHASLFTGIGGFDLAAEVMGWQNIFQVENDKFCNKVLEKNFPSIKKYGNIEEFSGQEYRGTIDVLSGGFPCQSFSQAGKQEADLTLWKEMYRVIKEVKPAYVVAENVHGLLTVKGGIPFDTVCSDLEDEGYEVQPYIIPACGINAPHKRNRIWIIAYNYQLNGNLSGLYSSKISQFKTSGICEDITPNSESIRHRGRKDKECGIDKRKFQQEEQEGNKVWDKTERCSGERIASNSDKGGGTQNHQEQQTEQFKQDFPNWQNFPTQSPVCGGNARLPNRLDRIKSLGNAIMWQIAHILFSVIDEIESKRK